MANYSFNFIHIIILKLFSNRKYAKKACSMYKVKSKGNFKCSQHLFVRISAKQQHKRDYHWILQETYWGTPSYCRLHVRPQCPRITFSFYLRLFPHYARTEKSLLLCRHIRLRPNNMYAEIQLKAAVIHTQQANTHQYIQNVMIIFCYTSLRVYKSITHVTVYSVSLNYPSGWGRGAPIPLPAHPPTAHPHTPSLPPPPLVMCALGGCLTT